MRRAVLLSVSVVTSLAATGSAPLAGTPAAAPCPTQAVAESSEAVLYWRPARPGYARALYACVKGTGDRRQLTDRPIRGLTGLRGTIAMWGDGACDVDVISEDCLRFSVVVWATDLRFAADVKDRAATADAGTDSDGEKVGSLRATQRLGLVWITCLAKHDRAWPDRRPDCVRPGGVVKRVYYKPADRPARMLDSGRRIDPGSLRLERSSATWRKSGRRRVATVR